MCDGEWESGVIRAFFFIKNKFYYLEKFECE